MQGLTHRALDTFRNRPSSTQMSSASAREGQIASVLSGRRPIRLERGMAYGAVASLVHPPEQSRGERDCSHVTTRGTKMSLAVSCW